LRDLIGAWQRPLQASRGVRLLGGRPGQSVRVPEFENPSQSTPAAAISPTITAAFEDGPLEGSSIETDAVEGRPPKTIDVPAYDGSIVRYCLAGWVQSGRSAVYTFLYRV
jgi:hypothetical protein